MSSPQSGLVEAAIVIITSVITWLLTPKTRRKLMEKISSQPKEQLLPRMKELIRERAGNDTIAAIIFGQFMHETANGTSRVFKQNNNMFGMKHPHTRSTLSFGPVHGYASYMRPEDSIDDLFLWFDNARFPLDKIGNTEAYVSLLKQKSYFEDSEENYLRGVKLGTAKFFMT